MSKVPDELDEKLARLSSRVESRASAIRAKLATRPELLALADSLKATFNARLLYVRIGD